MKAITVEPKKPGSARLDDIPEPDLSNGSLLVEAIAVGECGTDAEIVQGKAGHCGRSPCLLGTSDRALTGAGPVGLLAALIAKQRGIEEVHVLDRVDSGPKPELVRALGAIYHTGTIAGVGFEPDVIIECTGA